MVGGVEQYRIRRPVRPGRPCDPAGRRPTPVGRPRSAVGGRRLAPRRGARRPGRPLTRLAVLGCCGATDEELRVGLFAARGGALRHLTAWPGSYTAVVQVGRRITVAGDLAGARPVFHTPWAGGTAYATAALPLADLIEAQLDIGHLAALLACPDVPGGAARRTPYEGVGACRPGTRSILRDGAREITGYEPVASLAVAAPPPTRTRAVDGVRDALRRGRTRPAHRAPRTPPPPTTSTPGPSPAWAPPNGGPPAARPAPGIGADLSGGSASATLALLAAGPARACPAPSSATARSGRTPARRHLQRPRHRRRRGREAELERARRHRRQPPAAPRGRRRRARRPSRTPTWTAPLTDEPGPSLVIADRHRRRLAAGSADHFVGHGARQVLDAHPARLADLLMDRARRHLLRPVAALAKADGPSATPSSSPARVYRRRPPAGPYALPRRRQEASPTRLLSAASTTTGAGAAAGAVSASLAALAWCRPGPRRRAGSRGRPSPKYRFASRSAAPRRRPRRSAPANAAPRAALARHAADHRVLEQAAEVRSQRLHAPFLDNQVVRACRALPEALRVQPGARAAVLRTVLAGRGRPRPPPRLGRHRPTPPRRRRRGRACAPALGDLVTLFDAPLLADAGLIEARVVRKALRAASEGEPLPLDGLAELVSTELWLRRLLARRGTCWTGTAAPRQRAVAGGVVPRPTL